MKIVDHRATIELHFNIEENSHISSRGQRNSIASSAANKAKRNYTYHSYIVFLRNRHKSAAYRDHHTSFLRLVFFLNHLLTLNLVLVYVFFSRSNSNLGIYSLFVINSPYHLVLKVVALRFIYTGERRVHHL